MCLDPHIRVISEGSCDTEDWSNDDKHSGINYTLLYIHIENRWFTLELYSYFSVFRKNYIFKLNISVKR